MMNTLLKSLSLVNWIFFRLPLAFSMPFTVLTLWWVCGGFSKINELLTWRLVSIAIGVIKAAFPTPLVNFINVDQNLGPFLMAVIVLLLFFLGLLVAYNTCALLNWIVVKAKWKPIRYPTGKPYTFSPTLPEDPEFANVKRIGIVLAGGGAKGAFQAGAMRAIYRYLDEKKALGKVKVIAGTSIGSWNALFWLADLIKPENGWDGQSVHERWWHSISAKSLTAPSWYVPFLRNAFLSSEPWQQVFDHIFCKPEVMDRIVDSEIRFYLTRSNVATGELEFATNNPNPPSTLGMSYDVLQREQNEFMQGLKTAVFASMDLPPLFPYIRSNGKVFEDGGVINNVPVIFAAVEECDLVFILPLNSDFGEEPNENLVFARLFRVMDVRQGVLERDGFKTLYLYNELAALREHVEKLPQPTTPPSIPKGSPLERALQRKNGHMNVFAICPRRSFVNSTIGTQEFWKPKEAAQVFRVMHDATWDSLDKYPFDKRQDTVQMVLVDKDAKGGFKVDRDNNF